MRFKKAITDDEIKKVYEYLCSKGTIPLTREFIYEENEDGEIIGAYGVEIKCCIEPLHHETKTGAIRMITDAIATARTLGFSKIHCFTSNESLINHLTYREGGLIWGKKLTEIISKIL